jgi:alpha-tubulin suppressor-like RCC1 family protein
MNTRRNLIQFCLLGAVLLQALTSEAQPVIKVAAGTYYSLFLKSDGSLWAMGYNKYGQLGDDPHNFMTNLPEQIMASNVTAIAAGNEHSLFLKGDGSLWAMGDNQYGQLGDGSYSETNQPEMIVASNVTAIAAGYGDSLFLKSNGSLWAMGANGNGQLGDGTYNNTNQPEMIVASNVTAIAAGNSLNIGFGHSLFLKSDGSLWAMATTRMASWATALTSRPTFPSRFWPATSRRLPPEVITACLSRAMAVSGLWVMTFLASWAMAITTGMVSTFRS